MIKNKWIILFILIVCVGIFSVSKINSNTPPVTLPQPVLPENVSTVSVEEVGKSGISGTATLEDISGLGVVLIKFNGMGDDDEVINPAYIHEGTCKKPGQIKFKLGVPDAGESETDLEIPIGELIKMAPLTIDIQKSLDDKTIIACGEITN